MDLKEQLKKVTEDLQKLERNKEKFLADYDEKRKKILTKTAIPANRLLPVCGNLFPLRIPLKKSQKATWPSDSFFDYKKGTM